MGFLIGYWKWGLGPTLVLAGSKLHGYIKLMGRETSNARTCLLDLLNLNVPFPTKPKSHTPIFF